MEQNIALEKNHATKQCTKHTEPLLANQNAIIFAGFFALVESSEDMIFLKDLEGRYVAVSPLFAKMACNATADAVIGKTDFELFHDAMLAKRYTDDDEKLLASGENQLNYVEPLTDEHGRPRYSSTSKYILHSPEGDVIGILGISRDITRDYLARQRYQQELKYLFELPKDTFAALYMDIDEWRIIQHKRHVVGEYVIPIQHTMEAFLQNAIQCIPPDAVPEVHAFYAGLTREKMLALSESGKRQHTLEYPRRMPNGETIWVDVTIHFLNDPETGHNCAIWTLQNIHREKQEILNLQHAAEHDALTGLWNRAYTMQQIQKTIAEYPDAMHALFIVDVDNFKQLNDTKGHQEGDKFLKELAVLLKNSFRDSDIVGRLGGDEFFVFMRNVSNELAVREKAGTMIALSQLAAIPYQMELSISVGVGVYPKNGLTLEALYATADKALYDAKKRKNAFQFVEPALSYSP